MDQRLYEQGEGPLYTGRGVTSIGDKAVEISGVTAGEMRPGRRCGTCRR